MLSSSADGTERQAARDRNWLEALCFIAITKPAVAPISPAVGGSIDANSAGVEFASTQ
jgi:hypothetical protein